MSELEQEEIKGANPVEQPPDTRKDYTAIVYFHGIGRQRRYEEISRLVDSLDQYTGFYGLHYPDAQDDNDIGILRGQKLYTEEARKGDKAGPDNFYSYIGFQRYVKPTRSPGRKRPVPVASYRVYEGYWSSIVAEGLATMRVILWIAYRIFTPIVSLTRPWRDHKRLKLSYLFRLQRDRKEKGAFSKPISEDRDGCCVGPEKSIYEQLADAYSAFESWPARRAYPKGSFGEFKQFLKKGIPADRYFNAEQQANDEGSNSWLQTGWTPRRKPDDAKKMVTIATRWRQRFVRAELKIFALLFNVLIFIAGLILLASYAISPWAKKTAATSGAADQASGAYSSIAEPIARSFFDLPFVGALPSWYASATDAWAPPLAVSLVCVVIIFIAINLGRTILREFVSDIVFWTAREGKSPLFEQKQKILERAIDVLSHVMSDEHCKRIVVVGHSLGSPIGYEALLEIGKRRKAIETAPDSDRSEYDHSKISHFFSLGSPIEVITYFFDLVSSKFHRYNRLAVDIEGSARHAPFRKGRVKQISWVNIGARADPVSHDIATQGGLRSPWVDDLYQSENGGRRHSKAIEELRPC